MAKERPPEVISMPTRIEPIVPRLVTELPVDIQNWISEVKWHGVRAMGYGEERSSIRMLTTSQLEVSGNFPQLVKGFNHLVTTHTFLLDGEIISGAGRSPGDLYHVISRVGSTQQKAVRDSADNPCQFVAYDILFLDGQDLRSLPLIERKKKLAQLVTKPAVRYGVLVNYYEKQDHQALLKSARQNNFEAIVLKRRDSTYIHLARNKPRWLKLRVKRAQTKSST